MSPVEVPDWWGPMPPRGRTKIEKEHGTLRNQVKAEILDLATSVALGEEEDLPELVGLTRLSTLLDELIDEMVAEAREEGHSWADIGRALGVTRQAAQQRS